MRPNQAQPRASLRLDPLFFRNQTPTDEGLLRIGHRNSSQLSFGETAEQGRIDVLFEVARLKGQHRLQISIVSRRQSFYEASHAGVVAFHTLATSVLHEQAIQLLATPGQVLCDPVTEVQPRLHEGGKGHVTVFAVREAIREGRAEGHATAAWSLQFIHRSKLRAVAHVVTIKAYPVLL